MRDDSNTEMGGESIFLTADYADERRFFDKGKCGRATTIPNFRAFGDFRGSKFQGDRDGQPYLLQIRVNPINLR